MRLSAVRAYGRSDIRSRIHIDSDAKVVIDLDAHDHTGGPTTAIPCPRCESDLRVDDLDLSLMAAQLTCEACGLTFLQRLRHEGDGEVSSGRSAPSHRDHT